MTCSSRSAASVIFRCLDDSENVGDYIEMTDVSNDKTGK